MTKTYKIFLGMKEILVSEGWTWDGIDHPLTLDDFPEKIEMVWVKTSGVNGKWEEKRKLV